jgi:hypothetical protein
LSILIFLVIAGVLVFTVVHNVRRASRKLVSVAVKQREFAKFEAFVEGNTSDGDVAATVRIALEQARTATGSGAPQSLPQLTEALREALGAVAAASAEQVATGLERPKRKKKSKPAQQAPRAEPGFGFALEARAPLGALAARKPQPVLHALPAIQPFQPLSPLAARSARS